MSVSVCLSVCLSVCVFVCPRSYLQNYTSDLHQFFVRVTHGRGSVLLWRHSDDCLADKREDRQNCSVMPACCLGAYVNCIYVTAQTFLRLTFAIFNVFLIKNVTADVTQNVIFMISCSVCYSVSTDWQCSMVNYYTRSTETNMTCSMQKVTLFCIVHGERFLISF